MTDYAALAKKLGGTVESKVDYASLVSQMGGEIQPSEAPAPQVQGPVSMMDRLKDAARVSDALPGSLASVYKDYAIGAAKGAGSTAALLGEGVSKIGDYFGVPQDKQIKPYEWAADQLKSSNSVQTGGKVAENVAELLALGGLNGMAGRAVKLATTPGGMGTITAANDIRLGKDPITAAKHGVEVAVGAKVLGYGAGKVLGPAMEEAASKVAPEAEAAVAETAAVAPKTIALPTGPKLTPAEVKAFNRVPWTKAEIEAGQKAAKADRMAHRGIKPYEEARVDRMAAQAARDAERQIKPIPPSKLKPEVVETPPVTMRETAAKKAAQGSQSAADEAAARAARQKEHIAESYRQKAAKDAKNVTASDDLEAQLKASLKPKAEAPKEIPAEAVEMKDKVIERVESMSKQGMSRGQIKASVLQDLLKRSEGYKPADVQRMVDMILGAK